MLLLAMAAAGVLLPFTGGATVQAEGARRTLGAMLANDLIERIANTPFDQIVATYDGWHEAEGQVEDAAGAVLGDAMYARLSREASCAYVYTSQQSGEVPAHFVLATVVVRDQGQPVATIGRLIGK
jgi:hypothetical protein